MTKRALVALIVVSLVSGLIALGLGLPKHFRLLATAQSDNLLWGVLQFETEFANLNALLTEQSAGGEVDGDAVRLQTNITLSRINLINAGQVSRLWSDNGEAQTLMRNVAAYSQEAAAIVDLDRPLTKEDVAALLDLTAGIRPDVRRMAVLGVALGTDATQDRRHRFATQLNRTFILAILLFTGLIVALVYLDRLLAAARKQDADLNATAERLRATVAASLDGIIISDETGAIVEFNEAAAQIFGWTRAEILGRKMADTIVPDKHRAAHSNGMARYLATGTNHVIDAGRVELSALRKTGEEFPIELNITSTRGQEGERFIAYVRDISLRKITEGALIDARDRAERSDDAKSQFLAIMSHEIRTPLNGILGVLDLLKRSTLDGQQQRWVEVASASGEILVETVNEALDITRIEAGVMSLSPDNFSLRAVVRRVVDVLRTLANEKGLDLSLEFDPTVDREFFGDGGRINQILTNLIGNAIKFTETGTIIVRVSGIHGPDETAVTITVEDTGPGIPKNKLEAIFEDFVALARSGGRQTRGDGLGLSIARKIARLMGGDLKANSVEGEGSVFTFSFPLARSERKIQQAFNPEPATGSAPKSVLVVEDNPINRSVLVEMLRGFGHSVRETENGREGVEVADQAKFDLIIMDITMPEMDGIDATKCIRSGVGPNKDTYILGLTAHGREEYRAKAHDAGMDGFTTKPLRLSTLQSALEGIERKSDTRAEPDGVINASVVQELQTVLGAEKAQETAMRFFEELEADLSDLKTRHPAQEAEAIAETLHRLRGAASLLGLDGLTAAVDAASEASTTADAGVYRQQLKSLAVAGNAARSALDRQLRYAKGEPH